jgi:lauroyl/myristoyl acyltransferase
MNDTVRNRPASPKDEERTAPAPLKVITAVDILTVVGLVVMTPIAWLLPERYWPVLGRGVLAVVMGIAPAWVRKRARWIERCVGARTLPMPSSNVALYGLSRYFEDNLLLLKCYRPDRWSPRIEVEGIENLRAVRTPGRGVVLWFSHFHHYSLVSKAGMHGAGFAMSHLSHPRHGFSASRFGMHYLNRVRTLIEDRYLGERVYLGLDDASAALATLREHLCAGRVISSAARAVARRPVPAPFLGGTLPLATGAPVLARETGAALLPVHVVQTEPGRYRVIIEPEIAMDRSATKWAAAEVAAREYARRLEPVVLCYPDQWEGWPVMTIAA